MLPIKVITASKQILGTATIYLLTLQVTRKIE